MIQGGKIDVSNLPKPPCGKVGWPWTAQIGAALPIIPDAGSWPSITVITPSYNQARFIEETIRSVLLQGYPNLQYVVIDGGSADGSIEIIKKYSPWLAYWVSEPDRGQSHAINKGFARSHGEVVTWLNSDDVLQEHSLLTIGHYFVENPTCEFLAGLSEIRDVTGTEILWPVNDLPLSLTELLEYPLGRYLAQPSVFFTRSTLAAVGRLNEQLHYAMDLDFWLRIAEHHRIEILPQKLSWMRMHDNAKTFRENVRVYTEVESIINRYRSNVSTSKYRSLVRAVRRSKAHACLRSSTPHSTKQMRAAIVGAFNHDKTVVFSRDWLGTVLRLVMPPKLRKFIFTRP
jgi:glycosyltransferase involved in cell wall biosynthesis